MSLREIQAKRLEELNNTYPISEEERAEWIELMEELSPDAEDIHECEPIEAIKEERKLEPLKTQLLKLEMERKRLELELQIRDEKARIYKAKNLLDGKIWCDDCHTWENPSHFK